jgi:hypothetical protein
MASRREVHEQLNAAQAAKANAETVDTEVPPSDSGTKVDSDAKPAKAPKEKVVKEPTDCVCGVPDNGPTNDSGKSKFPGCGNAKSTRKFAPGHDAKLVGYLTRQFEAGAISADDAIAQVRDKSGGSALLLGKIKSAIRAVDERKAAKTRREEALKAKAAAEEAAKSTPEDEVNDQAVALADEASTRAGA